ncbi:MAG: ABC transporter permease [Acidimicrobiales bacterium]
MTTPPVAPPRPPRVHSSTATATKGLAKAARQAHDYAIVGICAALFAALSILSSAFLSSTNLLNILDQNASIGVIAFGETIVIISSNFDLSVGSTYSLAGIIGIMLTAHIGPALASVVAILAGSAIGVVNGGLVVLGRVHSFIATLASQYVIYGLALVVSGGVILQTSDPGFLVLGQDDGLGARYAIWCMLGVALASGAVLSRSVFGKHVYGVGGNRDAARLSGIRVGLVVVGAFAISGTTAALGGVMAASQVGTAQAGSGTGLELAGIASTIIGGTSIFGGEGAIWRTFLGVILLAMIGNGFDLLSLNATYQEIAEGALIIVAVVADAWARSRPPLLRVRLRWK